MDSGFVRRVVGHSAERVHGGQVVGMLRRHVFREHREVLEPFLGEPLASLVCVGELGRDGSHGTVEGSVPGVEGRLRIGLAVPGETPRIAFDTWSMRDLWEAFRESC